MIKTKLIAYREANPNTWVKNINDQSLKAALEKHQEYTDLPLHEKAAAIILGYVPKCECGNALKFSGKRKTEINGTLFGGWLEFCSSACAKKSNKTVSKRKETTLARYGKESWSQTDKAKEISTQLWSDEKKKKFNESATKTYIEKYGVEHYSKTKEYLEKRTATILENTNGLYTNYFQNVDKIKQSNILKYGVDSYNKTAEGRARLSKNNQMKLDPAVRMKSKFNRMSNRSVYSDELLNILITEDKNLFIDYIHNIAKINNFTHRRQISDELGVSYTYLNALFRKYGMDDEYLSLGTSTSYKEEEVYQYLKSLGVVIKRGDRTILKPKEIDLLVEDKKLGIEFNGLQYHSEFNGGKDKFYHLDKTNNTELADYQLLHIFENEWDDKIKNKIWKSIIKSKLGLVENKISARKCKIVELEAKEARLFFDNNHLSGFIGAEIHLGLMYNDILVSAISYGKSRFSKNENEIYRFASLLDHQVIGALGKLLNKLPKENLVSYADRRISGVDSVYSKFFKHKKALSPTWWGFKYGTGHLNHRLSYTKTKVKELVPNYDDTKSVFDNMFNAGYDIIWDCGNWKFYN